MGKLTALQVRRATKPGMLGDGNGLYLKVSKSGSKSWILRVVVHGRRRDLGLGSASLVSLAEARESAHAYRKEARSGGDPERLRGRQELKFRSAAKMVHQELSPTWRNDKHRASWLSSLEAYAFPLVGERPIETIGSGDILKILSPIWVQKNETAKRVQQRLSTIFDWAKGAGHYPHENPVTGIGKSLPRVKRRAEHLAAMPWPELPRFMTELALRDGVSARCLEFLILTASRSGEARGARWEEISGSVWTVPASRMKRGLEHRVPLNAEALLTLDKVRGMDDEFIFPSPRLSEHGRAREQSVMVFKSLFKRMQLDGFTVHGFRSTFRDWCSEVAKADREVAEAALSHTTGSSVERAYARSDLFERRRELMTGWGEYVFSQIKSHAPRGAE